MLRAARARPGPRRTRAAAGRRPAPRERPEVRPHRVHVLVDAELLLVLLLRVAAAPVRRARALVERGDDASAPRHPRELADHRAEVDRVVERRDAEGDVEGCRRRTGAARRRPGGVGTGRRAPRRTARGRGRSAGRRRGRTRRTRSRAAAGAARPSSWPRRSRARGRPGGRSGRGGAGSCARSRPRRGRPSRGRGSGTAAPRRSGRPPRTSPARARARASPRSRAASPRSPAPPDRGAHDAVARRSSPPAGAADELVVERAAARRAADVRGKPAAHGCESRAQRFVSIALMFFDPAAPPKFIVPAANTFAPRGVS